MQSLKRPGYWATHEFHRRSCIDLERKSFCGWNVLVDLIKACDDPARYNPADYFHLKERDKALIAALFLTGGRCSEVIRLRKKMFNITDGWVEVRHMPVLKHFRKIKDANGETVETKRKQTTREFAFRRQEPLAEILVNWIDLNTQDYLFPSNHLGHKHLSYTRTYQIVTEICNRTGFDGWPHRLRSERASQLASEYGFKLQTIMDFFGWKSISVAKEYVHSSLEDMKKLTPQIQYVV